MCELFVFGSPFLPWYHETALVAEDLSIKNQPVVCSERARDTDAVAGGSGDVCAHPGSRHNLFAYKAA